MSDGERALRHTLSTGGATAFAALFDSLRARPRRAVALRLDTRLAGRVDPSDVLQQAYLDAAGRVDDFLAELPRPNPQYDPSTPPAPKKRGKRGRQK